MSRGWQVRGVALAASLALVPAIMIAPVVPAPSAVASPPRPVAAAPLPVAAWPGAVRPVARPDGDALARRRDPDPGPFRWPLDGVPRPVRRFDPPPQPWAPGHRGVDLAASPGATVRSAAAGTVFFAGMVAGRPLVSVSHAGGLRTTYEPVQPSVVPGQRVAPGDPLGTLLPGHPGCPAGATCLHWGLRRGTEYLDPLTLVGLGRFRLLPVSASARAGWRARGRSG